MSPIETAWRWTPPPPFTKDKPVSLGSNSLVTGFLFPLVSKGFAPVSHLSKAPLCTIDSPHPPAFLSLFGPWFSVFSGPSPGFNGLCNKNGSRRVRDIFRWGRENARLKVASKRKRGWNGPSRPRRMPIPGSGPKLFDTRSFPAIKKTELWL